MARDPKARVVSIGDFQPYTDPTYGAGAIRTITYEDGTREVRFFHYDTQQNQQGSPDEGYLIREQIDPDLAQSWEVRNKEKTPPAQTPEQQQIAQQTIAANDRKADDDARKSAENDRETKEKQYNYDHPGPDGRRFYETNQERATRELREQADERAAEARAQQARAEARAAEAAQIAAQNSARAQTTAEANTEISRGNLLIQQQQEARAAAKDARDAAKPTFLSEAGTNNRFVIRYNPETDQVESMNNPNFDAVKEESERIRSLIASQVQVGELKLGEAKQQYQQWYDTNVKTPMLMAQEARDRAAEQRAALDAEERRRQFAASFSLQRGELGQRAGQAAMQAEQSLLPYRAGPTESAEMSSAINSLAAGGKMDTNAAAGIHFTPGAFEFDAPNFRAIAKQAAADALKGISTYKPSGQSYSTGDYSNVPAVNTSGAPSVPSVSGGLDAILSNLQSTYQFQSPQG